ncbi:MAG: hypothetical protein ACI4XN_02045 [Candidatus Kurthia intestinigallinarum]
MSNVIEQEQSKAYKLLSKVPQITIFFWIIKILCTTVGETFADFLNFNLGFGLTVTTVIMGIAFFIVLAMQFRTKHYNPVIYWATVVLISVFGTLVTDNLTDAMGVPLEWSTLAFTILLAGTFYLWYRSEGTLSIHSIFTPKREVYYWLTILFTFALGTAVGDLYSEQLGLGYLNTGLIVTGLIALIYVAYRVFHLNSILAFWMAYILTRPLGASLGDYLSQAKANGGLGLGTTVTSILFLIAILAVVVFLAITKIDTAVKNESIISTKGLAKKQLIVVLGLTLFVGLGGYFFRTEQLAAQANSTQTTLKNQLTPFIALENQLIQDAKVKDFNKATQDADKLEKQWDTNEPKLRSIDSSSWTKVDGTIDVVLASVRSSSPSATKIQQAATDSTLVMKKFN